MTKAITTIYLFFSSFLNLILLMLLFLPTKLDAQKPFEESEFVEIEGVKIHFRVWKANTTDIKGQILMVHGFCGSTFSWRKNISPLIEKGYEVIAIDLPPFGYSDKKRKQNHSISAQAYLMWQFLDYQSALKAGTQNTENEVIRWNLIGHSMGGAVIAAMASMRPDEVKSLILVDGAVMSSNKNTVSSAARWFFGTDYMYKLGEFAGKYIFFNEKKIVKLLVSAYGEKPDKEAVKGYLEGMNKTGTAGGIMQMSASKELYEFNINQIKAPALLIWGEKDSWVPLKNGEILKNRLKNAELEVVKGAAHCAMETHADIFNALVLKFLEKN
jgi:pimeloyl-ACP methyl ester carboxylesterase